MGLGFGAEPDDPDPGWSSGPAANEAPDVSGEGALKRVGDYQLLGEIARGGMGVVYRARQVRLNREVALKMILAGGWASPEQVVRFRVETTAIARLQHPNIVRIYEAGEHDGRPYYSMDFVDGGDLTALVQRGPVTAQRAARIVATLADAIEYAHRQGILHRDLKPSNILLDLAGNPRITDFGLARSLDHREALTLTGDILGSPNFMPPEQADGRRNQPGPANDVYGLGGILFHLLTGRAPFVGASVIETLHLVRTTDVVSPRLLNPAIPVDLATVCQKCLRREPNHRYGTAREVAEDLGRFLDGQPIRARPVGAAERVWRWSLRNRLAGGLIAATCLLAILVASEFVLSAARVRQAQRELSTNLYAADMKLAQLALGSGSLGRARELLARHAATGPQAPRGFEWDLYNRLAQGQDEFRLHAYTNGIEAIAFVPGTNEIITADHGTSIHVRRFPSLVPRAETHLTSPLSFISEVSVSSDGRWFVVSRFRDAAIVFETATLRQVATIPGRWHMARFAPSKPVIALIEGDAVTAGNPGRLELWDLDTQTTVATWPDAGSTLAWSPDGQTIFAGGWRQQISARNASDGRVRWTVGNVGEVIWLMDGGGGFPLISANWDGEVVLWDSDQGRRLSQLLGHRLITWKFAFSPDRRWVATANSDRTVKIWDARTGTLRQTLLGHEQEVWSVAFSPDGTRVVSGDKLGNLMVWRLPDDRPGDGGEPYENLLGSPVWSPTGSHVAFGLGGGQVGLIGVASGSMERRIPDAELPLAFGPDGRTLEVLTRKGVATVPLDGPPTPMGGYRWSIPPFEPKGPVAVSRDGHWLAVGRGERDVEIWDLRSGRLRTRLQVAKAGDLRLAFSPDGESLGVANQRAAEVEVFDRGLSRHRVFVHDPLGTGSIAFSPDGHLLASAGMDDRIMLWDLAADRRLAVLPGDLEGASGVAFSPDGLTLAVLSGGRWLQLWNVATHRELGQIEARRQKSFVSFSPDGRTLMAWHPYPVYTSFQFWRSDLQASNPPPALAAPEVPAAGRR